MPFFRWFWTKKNETEVSRHGFRGFVRDYRVRSMQTELGDA